ncbi:hypothetical protein HHK36_011443 [Tetracentron sinense]|uniref:TF-B3 domain-containing protein n=1 Tax=Tetracentron sinense TaxID=13715 RepID=A0A834ZGC2_TETSI|nr:hypothetical protein HHK36_011443 [Tetracentron sinense]
MHPTPFSKHKALVPQANARIAHRVWLGSFETQESSARAASMFPFPDTTLDFDFHRNPIEDHHLQEQNEEEREVMFEKPLTPSDVGKLNRLVIPKQHAEKYFPLGGDSDEKGLILSFEDESGNSWRFRYSYWNSSQSYVLTKGWSRFVKDKRLDAGDVVWFERHRHDGDRIFIRWRRRAVPVQDSGGVAQAAAAAAAPSGAWTRVFYSAHHPYPSHPPPPPHGPLYQPDCLHAVDPCAQNQTSLGNSKRLRLFGVNLDCQLDGSEPPGAESSQDQAHFVYSQSHGPNYDHQMDFNYSRDDNQTRNGRGKDVSM